MKYTLTGNFYEACDCDVVCSCWVGRSPPMGSCTGLFVWEFDAGNTIDVSGSAVDVGGCRVMLITQGSDCNDAANAIVVFSGSSDVPTPAQQTVLMSALSNQEAPWGKVVTMDAARKDVRNGIIHIAPTPSGASISITGSADAAGNALTASASLTFPVAPITLHSQGENTFIARSTGNPTGQIDAGWVELDNTSSGLDILATATYAADEYVFDLDITDVSAVRGKFAYISP